MSTKSSIKYQKDTIDGPSFHLFEECHDAGPDRPVYLELSGVQVELETQTSGAMVTVRIPREWARALGLLTSRAQVGTTGNPLSANMMFTSPTFTGTMTMPQQTCDTCKHYSPAQGVPRAYGHCAWIDDHADDESGAFVQCEYGYCVSVGPKFGCIKWEAKV